MRRESTLRKIQAKYMNDYYQIPWYHFIKKAKAEGFIHGMEECLKRSRF